MKINLISILFLLISSQLYAADPLSFRVGFVVEAEDSIKGRIESYISRELRSLGDVIQSKENYDYFLSIIALKLRTESGYDTGVALSITIVSKFENKHMSFILEDLKDEDKSIAMEFTSNLYYYPYHWLQKGSNEDLQSMCKDIVADFDIKFLQSYRDIYQIILDNKNKIRGLDENEIKKLKNTILKYGNKSATKVFLNTLKSK